MGEFKKAQRAAELELNHFDSFTRRVENIPTPKDKEKSNEKYETSSLENEENKDETEVKTT